MLNKKLHAIILFWLLDERVVAAKRFFLEVVRVVTFKKRVVSVFLQLDDPYSYLLSHYLTHITKRYSTVEFRFYLCQSLRGAYMPQPALLAEYALQDCKLLAAEFGIPFLDKGDTPAVEYRRPLLEFLASEQDEAGFGTTMINALSQYWRGDVEGVSRTVGPSSAESDETSVLIGQNQLLLRKMGHYDCAMLHYAGEWYWGVDRLLYLVERLDQLGLNRFDEAVPELDSLQQAMRLNLPAAVPSRAAKLPALELFYSFRSPFSYLALQQVFDLADAFGLQLKIRPVLSSLKGAEHIPRSKLIYSVIDANREARRRSLSFGRIEDAIGPGVERCIAAFYYAQAQNCERDFLLAAGQGIFATGIDMASDAGMQEVAERCGLFWPDLQAALRNTAWRSEERAAREALDAIGLWGLPVLKIGEQAFWGQDRVWLAARKIEDLCHGGEGILE